MDKGREPKCSILLFRGGGEESTLNLKISTGGQVCVCVGGVLFEHMAWPEATAVESESRFFGGSGRVGNDHLSAHREFFPSANPTYL